MRLRRSDCGREGITRRRAGKGWAYYWPDGRKVVEPEVLERCTALVLPPAWRDVWICPWPNGHIQALGTDAAGRRQYRYHDHWRLQRDAAKHRRVLEFAERLPAAREHVATDLGQAGLTRIRVLAAAFRMLDLGFFRVGCEEYAEENSTYGLATMRREHVTLEGEVLTFEFTAKHGKQRVQSLADRAVCNVVRELLDRDDPSPELLAYRWEGGWRDVRSDDINGYLRTLLGTDVSAKDFRTWHATVLMAVGLAVSAEVPATPTARKRAVARAVKEVAHYLGNTPAVCRSSYIDPRIIDLYDDGLTVHPALERLGADADFGQPATHGQIEAAVLELLRQPADASDRRRASPRAGSRVMTAADAAARRSAAAKGTGTSRRRSAAAA
jgi:DNA topoisomerase IB